MAQILNLELEAKASQVREFLTAAVRQYGRTVYANSLGAEAMVLTVCEGNCLPENLNAQIELPCIVVRQAGDFFTCRVRLIMTELSVSGPSPAPARRPGFRKDCGSPRFRASYDSN